MVINVELVESPSAETCEAWRIRETGTRRSFKKCDAEKKKQEGKKDEGKTGIEIR